MSVLDHPWCLLGLLVVPALAALSALAFRHTGRMVAPLPAWRAVVVAARPLRVLRSALVLSALALLPVAAASPRLGENAAAPVVLVIDVSLSMLARDCDGMSRIEAARQWARQLLSHLDGREVALVVFAGEAQLRCPLTEDIGAVRMLLDDVTVGEVPPPSTDIWRALDEAQSAGLDGTKPTIVLLSDGEVTESRREGGTSPQADPPLWVVGFGTPEGARIPLGDAADSFKRDRSGGEVVSRLDEGALRSLVKRSSGVYLRWNDESAAADLARRLGHPSELLRGQDRWRLLLLLVACVLLCVEWCLPARALLRPGLVRAALVTVLVLLAPSVTRAQTAWLDGRAASAAFGEGRLVEAESAFKSALERQDDLWQAWFGLSCVYLRAERYADALSALDAASARTDQEEAQARIQYNRGHTLVGLGRLREAEDAYKAVLRIEPANDNARHNLAVVRARLRRETPQREDSQAPQSSPSVAGHGSLEEVLSEDDAERLLREVERERQRGARPVPGAADPDRPWPDEDW